MSRIFRSDDVRIGDRVVLRRMIEGKHSDIIGHVADINDEGIAITPQMVGGFLSSLESVFVPKAQIHIVKKLSPRTVRNSDIRSLELAHSQAFPGIEHTWCGPWLLRAGDGITERSNSAAPLGPSAPFEPVPVETIQAFYRRHRLPAKILIPERIAKNAESLAREHSWELGQEILVMARPLDELPPLVDSVEVRVDEQPDEEWLAMYHFRSRPLPKHALDLLRERIDGKMGFGRLVHPEAGTIAITRGTITGEDRPYLGYSAVEVAPTFRRQGLGTHLGIAMLHWGKSLGAETAYLQVAATNRAGIGLYEKLGFVEHHRHRYATIPDPAFHRP